MKAHTALVLCVLAVSATAQSCDLNTDDISTHCTDSNGCFVSSQDTDCCNVITQFQSNLLCHVPLFSKIGELASGEGCEENVNFDTAQAVVCDADGEVVNNAACNAAVDSVEEICRDENMCLTGEPNSDCCAALESYNNAGCSNDDFPIAQGEQCTATTVEDYSSTCEAPQSCAGVADAVEEACQDDNNCMTDSPDAQCCVVIQAYNAGSCSGLTLGTGCNVTFTTASDYSDDYCSDPCEVQMNGVEEVCLGSDGCASLEPDEDCCAAMEAYMNVGDCSGTLEVGDECTPVGEISTYAEACDLSPCNGLLEAVENACLQQDGDNNCMATDPSTQCCAAIAAYEQQSCSEDDYPVEETGSCPSFTTLSSYSSDNCDNPQCNVLLGAVQTQCVENECVSTNPNELCCTAMESFNNGDCDEDDYSLDLGDNCDFSTISQFHSDHCNDDSGGVQDCPGLASSIVSSCTSGTLSVCVDNTPSDSCCGHVRDFISGDCSADLVVFPNTPLCSYTPSDVNEYASDKCPEDGTSSASTLSFVASMVLGMVAVFFGL